MCQWSCSQSSYCQYYRLVEVISINIAELVPSTQKPTRAQSLHPSRSAHLAISCLRPFDCCNKLPQMMGWLKRHLFLTVLESGKSKIKVLVDSVSGEGPPPGSQAAIFSLCPHMVEGMRELSGVSCKATNSIIPLKVPSPNTITLGIRFQYMNFRGHKCLIYSKNIEM